MTICDGEEGEGLDTYDVTHIFCAQSVPTNFFLFFFGRTRDDIFYRKLKMLRNVAERRGVDSYPPL